jgi:hypothetical protein
MTYGTKTVLRTPESLTSNLNLVPFAEVRMTPCDVLTPTLMSPPTTCNFSVGFVVPIPTEPET